MSSRKRLSLTKTDRETSAGLELAALLQDVSADGQVAVEEVEQLKAWLNQYPESTLPAQPFLVSVIDAITQDGVITDDELETLSDAIQKVLPPDLRLIASLQRKERRAAERAKQVADRQAEKAQKTAERERTRPIETADFMVAGATLPQNRDACADVDVGQQVWLQREPDNPHDQNAILIVKSPEERLGYVPRQFAEDLAPLLDGNCRQDATVKKLLETSRGHTIPVVIARLYRADAGLGSDNPQRFRQPSSLITTKEGAITAPTASSVSAVHPPASMTLAQWIWVLILILVIGFFWMLL